jgi:hypothetical protein
MLLRGVCEVVVVVVFHARVPSELGALRQPFIPAEVRGFRAAFRAHGSVIQLTVCVEAVAVGLRRRRGMLRRRSGRGRRSGLCS